MKKLLITFISATLLIGCKASPPTDQHVVQLNFWNGFSGPDGKAMGKIVDLFNKENAGKINVKMQIIPWGTYYDKVTLGLAYGGAPDVFVLHTNRFPEYANHGVLDTFDDLVKSSKLPTDDFIPRAWKNVFWQGKQMAVPLDCHPLGMYYNTDLFREAGIEKPPTNYDEFIAAAKKLTVDKDGDGKPDQWGFAFTWLHSNSINFLTQFGTNLLNPAMTESGLNRPPAKDAMNRMLDIIHAGVAPKPEGQDAWLGFQTGKVAMAFEGVYMMSSLEKQAGLHYAAAPVPQFGTTRAVWAGSHLLTMPKGLPETTRNAGWKFIHFLSDHSIIWAEGGQVPVRKTILRSKEFQDLRIQSQFAKQLDYVTFEPRSMDYNLIATFGDSAFEAILNEISTPGQALALATRRIDNRLRQK